MQSAHIDGMGRFFLFSLLGAIILLFLPVWLDFDGHYDMNRRRFAFKISAYKIVKLLGGYATTYQGGVALHVSKKKAILVDYSEMDGKRKKFSFLKSFRLKSFSLTAETGAEYLIGVSLAHVFLRAWFFLRGGKKENIRNSLWLTDGDVLRITTHVTLFFNLFILLMEFFKFLKEKICILCRKKTKSSIV